ncbi:MAG: PfkB family carbohydrate kinase [Chloroflexaceae bacterium]|jgi:sugar/nucleoside kinase (ribokinase family)|nr:PfkB family carbohydrate kinase [Chloroflexaceae bacterium]
MIDYLALGHLTRDLLPDMSTTAGGTVLYAATTAQRLGLKPAVFTAIAPDHTLELPFPVALTPSFVTSIFENRYHEGNRSQWLHAVAAPLNLALLPEAWRHAPIVHLGPVTHECSLEMLAAFPQALIGVTPQGWLRHWDEPLPAPVRRVAWCPPPELLKRIDLLVLSIEDVDGDEALVRSYARHCPLVALTRGAEGLTLFVRGESQRIAAVPAWEIDPTGAGDVFAAAMLACLFESGDPLAAAHFAAATAACAVEGHGVASIPTQETVQARMGGA